MNPILYRHRQFNLPDELEQQVKDGLVTESAARVIHVVNHFCGASLLNRADELQQFTSRGIDGPLLSEKISNCGLFALATWASVGIDHKLLREKYAIGMAIAWLITIAEDLGAVRHPGKDGPPTPGSLMHYYTHGKNNNHVEFCLSKPVSLHALWVAHHAGGGSHHCAIGKGHSDIKWSSGRPLQEWYDIDALLPPIQRDTIVANGQDEPELTEPEVTKADDVDTDAEWTETEP